MTAGSGNCENIGAKERKNSRETIHSGHFMVSDFEAEAQDDEGIEVPEPSEVNETVEEIQGVRSINQGGVITYAKPTKNTFGDGTTVSIDGSLTKLFQTMSLAYRQNITSPKWNRFKGLRLRWKDKIRLNNVIWRCWHMQYIQKKNMTICQFALDVDIHNRPEAVVLEGKYWKRRLRAVTAEYKKWRLFYKNSLTGVSPMLDQSDTAFLGLEEMDWAGSFFNKPGLSPEDCLLDSIDFTDILFSPCSNGPLFPFPNPREIARSTGNSDLLQPGLVQLQPDLMDDDDMMDIHEMLAGRGLPTVPEEDFFPEVEETAGLPPSSSPPSVSTPTPTTHLEFTSRQTAVHPYDEPQSPQLYSHQDTFIPSQSHHSSPNTGAASPILTTLQLRQEGSSEKHGFARRTGTTTSPHIRLESPDERIPERKISPPSLHSSSSSSESFAVPKNVPKKKYFGGGTSNWSSVPSVQANMLGSNALVFPAPSYPNQELNLHSDKNNRAQVSPIGHVSAPLPPLTNVVHVSAETDQSAPSDSNFLSHILSTDSCAPSVPHSPQSHTTKIKVARITPRPYPEIASSTSSSSKTNSKAIFRPTAAGSSALSVSNSNPQPQLLPNVTLSAVTPSSIKSIPPSVVSAQASNWPPGNIKNIKTSPPYPEPNSPTATHSISSSPPTKPFRPKSDAERVQYKEHRRVCHINAEQKRRCNIKNNFEMLHSLIPSVNQNPNAKVSKATMLHKGAEYILQMKQERQQLAEQAEQLRNQIETLSTEISLAQSMLPATGAGMRPTRHNKIKEKFDNYIREQTLANPKYYVLALIAQPLLQSYNSSVSTASVDDLCRSSMAWLDQHCSLNVLRPVVSNAMRKLSVTTNILTTPETLYEDIFKQVAKQESGVKFSSAGFSPSEQR